MINSSSDLLNRCLLKPPLAGLSGTIQKRASQNRQFSETNLSRSMEPPAAAHWPVSKPISQLCGICALFFIASPMNEHKIHIIYVTNGIFYIPRNFNQCLKTFGFS